MDLDDNNSENTYIKLVSADSMEVCFDGNTVVSLSFWKLFGIKVS
jgi:hypothetical protein